MPSALRLLQAAATAPISPGIGQLYGKLQVGEVHGAALVPYAATPAMPTWHDAHLLPSVIWPFLPG